MEEEHLGTRFARISSPFGDGTVTGAVRSYRPDVTIIQGVAADPSGNVVMAAPFGEAYWGSLAATKGAIACVERVVSHEALREHNELVTVPGHVVQVVCEVPFGSHPYGLYASGFEGIPSYVEDHDFIVELQGLTRDPDTFAKWVEEWVTGLGGHQDYLAKLGGRRLSRLRGEADPAAWELEALEEEPEDIATPTDSERMVIAASRLIMERIAALDAQAVLAGVGYSNLAAWLAVRTMRQQGHDVQLMAEIGMFGYDPRPGEPFIFSLRNLPSCTLLTDVMAVLGTYVGGPATRSIGAVGAAQVDRQGRLNSTWSADGRFVVGSGGANDIASTTDELIVTVKHNPGRLVEEVPFVTSPGERVRAIVTSEGVLERTDGEFELVRFFQRDGESATEAAERLVSRTGWPLKISDRLTAEPEPSADDLETIRQFDPRRTFL
jgi:acyl CoA:acetate/3-ketoacid CoA transferase beta subunit